MSVLVLPALLLLPACGGGGDDGGSTVTNADLPVDTVVAAEWSLNATEYRDQIGSRVGYDCPADGEGGNVWGTGPYTDDSSVCTAGVFAGLITFAEGGRVVIEIEEGLESYPEGEANSVRASSWPSWPGSFDFPEA